MTPEEFKYKWEKNEEKGMIRKILSDRINQLTQKYENSPVFFR